MIRVEEFTDKFLTCSICQCVYDDPAILQCDHTFCRKCLTGLVKCKPDAIRDKVIPCALRCEGTRVPDPEAPVETWASQIKTNFYVINLMDEVREVNIREYFVGYSDNLTGTNCIWCTAPAVQWCSMCRQSLCEGCIAGHRKDLATCHHTLSAIPDSRERQKQRYVHCEDHYDELVKLFCESCNKAICNTCCNLHHRKCESVVLFDIKLEYLRAQVLKYKNQIDTKIENHMVSIAKNQSKVEELGKNKRNIQSIIRRTYEKIIDLIREKESALLQKLEETIETEINNLEEFTELEKARIQIQQQRSHVIQTALQSGSLMDMYNICQSNLSLDRSRRENDNIQSAHRVVTCVQLGLNTVQLIDSINKLNFGKLTVSGDMRHVQEITFYSPVLQSGIGDKVPGDEADPDLRDMTVLVTDGVQTLVVTDFLNGCVKSFYTRNSQSCHSRLPLDSWSFGITQLNENQVMVAVPYSSQIVTVAVTPDLVLLSTITTNKVFRSLAVISPSVLAAGCGGCVDIINFQGQVMKSISRHWLKKLFEYPDYMCVTNKGNLLVSDRRKKSVTCLTSEGNVVWRYAPTGDQALLEPYGITCTTAGDILLVDCYSNKVIHLTEAGQYVRDVFTGQDGLFLPRGICLDKDNSIYVCEEHHMKHFKFNQC